MIIRDNKKEGIFQFDKRKKKRKVSPLATLLIEHLTEESNGSAALKRVIVTLVGVSVINLDIKQIHYLI
jgi:hypothetical protein